MSPQAEPLLDIYSHPTDQTVGESPEQCAQRSGDAEPCHGESMARGQPKGDDGEDEIARLATALIVESKVQPPAEVAAFDVFHSPSAVLHGRLRFIEGDLFPQ